MSGFHPFKASVDMQAWTALFYFILCAYTHFCTDMPYDAFIFFYAVAAGICMIAAITFQSFSLRSGKGGLVMAIG